MIGIRDRVTLALLLTCSLAATTSFAQGFNAVTSRDGLDVWAVGPAGTVYRSMNTGGTWASSTLGAASLNGVAARGLTVMVIADGGTVYRTTNAGGSWTSQALSGTPDLKSIALPTDLVGYVVGSGGTIFRTDDGGVNWSPQTSGTAENLNAVAFSDADNGFAAGANGTLLKTEDGGAIWTPLAPGTTRDLLDVAAQGSTVWAVGRRATAVVSTDGGMNWTAQNLKMDSHGDVRAVSINSLGHVTLAGGGGFVRTTTDGGATWAFHLHKMLAPITDIFFASDSRAFFANSANRCVMNTTNSGTSWNLPTAVTPSYVWNLRLAAGGAIVRGDALHQNGQNPNSFYVVLGVGVYKSADRGDNWTQIGTITGGGQKTNSFYVHPADSMLMVAAVGTSDRISRSTDGGLTWTTTKTGAFTEYGMPLEMDPDNNNHLMFMPEDGKVYESFDFGATWSTLSTIGFRSPCDIIITPDQTSLVYVGDGVTGSGLGEVWKSTDGGLTFTKKFTGSGSEVPMMAISRLNTSTVLATQWGSGGVQATKNYGETWPSYHSASSAWGCDFADDDPSVAIHGQYSGGNSYLTTDLGVTFTTIGLGSANYAFSAPDRATFIAQQGNGVYKLAVTYPVTVNNTQNLIVQIPNGGNTAMAGQNFMVRWFSQNVALASLEYQRSPIDPWVPIAAMLDSYRGEYDWLVPNDPTTTAKVRVIDLWDGAPIDESNTTFTIVGFPALTLSAPGGGESWQNGSSHDIEWSSILVNDVTIEYRTGEAEPWIPIEASWPAANHPYSWTVPNAPTAEARIRVRDLSGAPADSSELFSIIVPDLTGLPATLDLGMVEANTTGSQVLTLYNSGTAPLEITDVASDNAYFAPSRTAFTIAAADSDTIMVSFSPDIVAVESGILTILSDDPDSPSSTVNLTGEGTYTTGAPESAPKPTVYLLRQNRPNPFTGVTRIDYALPSADRVRLDVFDMAGRRVATLVDQEQEAGFYSVEFGPNARTPAGSVGDLSSGVYFYRIQAGAFTRTQRMLLLR